MTGTQIALIVVGIFLVIIAIFVGITQFRENPLQLNDEAVSREAALIVASAQQYYEQSDPRSFRGLTLEALGQKPETDNGSYEIEKATELAFMLLATGKEDRDGDGEPLQYRLTYNALSDTTTWETVEE